MTYFLASNLNNEIIVNNGFSFNPVLNILNPKNGYMVSRPETEQIFMFVEFQAENIQEFIQQHEDKLNENTFIGAWFNHEDHCVYLDISELIEDKETAIRRGILHNQLAIFDNNNKNVINLPELQRSGTIRQQRTYLNMKIKEL